MSGGREFECRDCGGLIIQFPKPPPDRRCAVCSSLACLKRGGMPPDDLQGIRTLLYDDEQTAHWNAIGCYRDETKPERACDHCGRLYQGPAVYCSLQCAQGDAGGEATNGNLEYIGWHPEWSAPVGRYVRTRRQGEKGTNVCALRLWPDGTREWCTRDGVTTITHHSFAAPTHWQDL